MSWPSYGCGGLNELGFFARCTKQQVACATPQHCSTTTASSRSRALPATARLGAGSRVLLSSVRYGSMVTHPLHGPQLPPHHRTPTQLLISSENVKHKFQLTFSQSRPTRFMAHSSHIITANE